MNFNSEFIDFQTLVNKTLEEFEMALIKKPKKPNSHPFIINIEKKNRDWQWFLY